MVERFAVRKIRFISTISFIIRCFDFVGNSASKTVLQNWFSIYFFTLMMGNFGWYSPIFLISDWFRGSSGRVVARLWLVLSGE